MRSKLLKLNHVKIVLFLVFLITAIHDKIALSEENSYRYAKQSERFNSSEFTQFRSGLSQTIGRLEQKSDNLEAMSQNLEGRVNMLASEKDTLNKAYLQMKVRQSMLEKDHTKLKKKTTSLEVAYKKLSSKVNVAKTSKKPKPVARKKSGVKTAQKKTIPKPKSTAKKTSATGTKNIRSEKIESTSHVQVYPPVASGERKKSEEQQGEKGSGIDIKKINEKGIDYGKKGMYDEAIKEFQKVAAIEPDMANVHYNLGLAYKKKGMHSDADREFSEYERLKGQNN